jgi:hypothetical protein
MFHRNSGTPHFENVRITLQVFLRKNFVAFPNLSEDELVGNSSKKGFRKMRFF